MLLSNVSVVFLKLLHHLSNDYCNTCIEKSQIEILNNIISAANAEQHIDMLVFFGNEVSIGNYIAPIMSGLPKMVIIQTCNLDFFLTNNFNSNIFFLAFGKLKGADKWQFLSKALDNIQRYVRGIFVSPYQSSSTFAEHFDWCWRSGFVNIIALVEPFNLYQEKKARKAPFRFFVYTPFPHLNVSELPLQAIGERSYFSNRLIDFRGYKMRTVVQYDPPRVFRIEIGSPRRRRSIIGGYAARTYREFLKYHNGQLEIVAKSNLSVGNILNVIEQLNHGRADLSMNIYFNFPGVRSSYPLSMTRWCILLPSSGSIPAYAYFLRPFQFLTWLAYAAMLLFLSLMAAINEYILSKVRSSRGNARFSFGRAFLETLRLILFVSTPPIYRCFKMHYAYHYTLVSLFGFILSNYYLAVLTSFRTRTILGPQVDTMQEMVDLNISINAVEHEIPLVLQNRGLPKGFADLLKPRNFDKMIKEILSLHVMEAYLVREDTLQFVLAQEKDEVEPTFHAAKECIATIPVGFLMPAHSQFKGVLDVFTLQVAAFGLIQRWFHITILDGFRAGLLTLAKRETRAAEPLTLPHFQFAFLIILIGHFLALLSFGLEQLSRFGIRTTIYLKSSAQNK